MICFHVCSLFSEKDIDLHMQMLASESLVDLLIPLIYHRAKFNHGCETQTSVLINGYQ